MDYLKKHINCYREDTLEFVTMRINKFVLGHKSNTAIIAVAGPGACGKSTFSRTLHKELKNCKLINLDDYRKSRVSRAELGLMGSHPDAVKLGQITGNLKDLKHGSNITKPVYNTVTGTDDQTEEVTSSPIILLDGEAAAFAELQSYIDFLIFIDVNPAIQLKVRLNRDVNQHGHSQAKALNVHLTSDLQDFPAFGAASRKFADIILQFQPDFRHTVKMIAD